MEKMDIDRLVKRMQGFSEHFCYGELSRILATYTPEGGIMVLGMTGEDPELWWGVEDLKTLQKALPGIKKDQGNLNFIFRYAGEWERVQKGMETISGWGYEPRNVNVGYFTKLANQGGEINSGPFHLLPHQEIAEFKKLEEEIFPDLKIASAELPGWCEDQNRFILVFRDGGEIGGFVAINTEAGCAFVRSLGVSSHLGGQGWGRKLMQAGLDRARSKGAVSSFLWVDKDNSRARKLYESLGYEQDPKETEAVFGV